MTSRLFALIAVVAVLTSMACGNDDDAAAPEPDGPAVTTTEAAPDAAYDQCTDEAAGYSIGYPSDWDVAGDDDHVCRYFDPDSADVTEGSEPDTAIIVTVDPVSFDRAVEGATSGRPVAEVRERTDLTVDDRRAVQVEAVASDEGLYPEGTVQYTYLVDFPGERTFAAQTNDAVAEGAWPDSKDVLDEMMARLTVEQP